MIRRLLIFWGACTLLFLLIVLPARTLSEDRDAVVIYAGTAWLLCIVPTTLTLIWSLKSLSASSQQQVLSVLGGTGVRMFFVLLSALGLTQAVPYFKQTGLGFWIWVLVFYMITLALEMAILLTAQSQASSKDQDLSTRAPTSQ